jgi:hypothetical protein
MDLLRQQARTRVSPPVQMVRPDILRISLIILLGNQSILPTSMGEHTRFDLLCLYIFSLLSGTLIEQQRLSVIRWLRAEHGPQVHALQKYGWRQPGKFQGSPPRFAFKFEPNQENNRLRRAVADLTLEKLILQEAVRGSFKALLVAGIEALVVAVLPRTTRFNVPDRDWLPNDPAAFLRDHRTIFRSTATEYFAISTCCSLEFFIVWIQVISAKKFGVSPMAAGGILWVNGPETGPRLWPVAAGWSYFPFLIRGREPRGNLPYLP